VQIDLFDHENISSIPGLLYQPDFLTPDEENILLNIIRTIPLKPAQYKEFESKCRIMSFGGIYDFTTHTVKPSPPIDKRLLPLRNRVAKWMGINCEEITQLLVTEYTPGTQLGWHRDVPVYETIIGISLGNEAVIKFRRWPPDPINNRHIVSLKVAPRSIYKLENEARWGWQHSVPKIKIPRWAITLRIRRAK